MAAIRRQAGAVFRSEQYCKWKKSTFNVECYRSRNVSGSGLRNVQSVQMHKGPPTSGGPPHLTYRAQKKIDFEKL